MAGRYRYRVSSGHQVSIADACPGILDLHEARDGLVARIRLPGGYASAARLRSLAGLASWLGSGSGSGGGSGRSGGGSSSDRGSVDLTARGNVQLRGIRPDQAGELARRAASAGLLPSPAHDRARNITASPLAGLAGHPELRALVCALDRAVLADAGLAALTGRFLFCLDDGTGRAGLSSCDAGLRRYRRGAELIVAGRATGLRGPARQAAGLAVEAARVFLRERDALLANAGPARALRARAGPARALPARAGPARAVPARAGPARAVPAIARMTDLPDGGACVAAALGGTLGDRVTEEAGRLPLGIVPAAGHVPGAAGGPAAAAAARVDAAAAPVAVVAAPLARLTAPQLALLASLVRPGDAARLAAAGRIVVPLAAAARGALARLAATGLLVSDDDRLSAVTACSGMSCARSLADVRAVAGPLPGLAAVHWAGCSRQCGLPADASAVIATSAGHFTLPDGHGFAASAGQLTLPDGRALATAGGGG